MSNVGKVSGPEGPRGPDRNKNKAGGKEFQEYMRISKLGDVDPDGRLKKKFRSQEEEEAEAAAAKKSSISEEIRKSEAKKKKVKIDAPELLVDGVVQAAMPEQFAEINSSISEHIQTEKLENEAPLPPPPSALPQDEHGNLVQVGMASPMPEHHDEYTPPPQNSNNTSDVSLPPALGDNEEVQQPPQADEEVHHDTPPPPKKEELSHHHPTNGVLDQKTDHLKDALKTALHELKEKEKSEKKEEVTPLTKTGEKEEISSVPTTPRKKEPSLKEHHLHTEIPSTSMEGTAPPTQSVTPGIITPAATPPPYTHLDAKTLALFEAMVSKITIIKETDTKFYQVELKGKEFGKNSPFYGASIVIEESKSSPGQYNITLVNVKEEGLRLLTKSANPVPGQMNEPLIDKKELNVQQSMLQNLNDVAKGRFIVQNLTATHEDSPVFRRKEEDNQGGDQEQNRGQQEQQGEEE